MQNLTEAQERNGRSRSTKAAGQGLTGLPDRWTRDIHGHRV